ncbi:hypothetical protein BDR06DRAFT_979025 [Suillus hirtellus]|nr:hypothetical protein BDR06DRAFT_979025 [Suillus hirtellus]
MLLEDSCKRMNIERCVPPQPLSNLPISFKLKEIKPDDALTRDDLDEGSAVNATGHLVVETVNSLLRYWPNTRHRIGHTIVLRIIPVGTLLYHGATSPHLPTALDWVAVEPEHSILFCQGYFDGSSAVRLREGTMDTQDPVAWSEMKREWVKNEEQRIKDLCKWGQKYGVNGFVSHSESMMCNFGSHIEVASFLNLESTRLSGGNPELPEDPNTMHRAVEITRSASWHDHYPGETRIMLGFSGLVSFYDTALVPSLVPRRIGLERWDHRHDHDGKMVLQVVVDRYASRLEFMHHLLNLTLNDGSIFNHAQQIQRQLRTVLLPYTVFAAVPPNNSVTANATNSWAVQCHGTTRMPSERLLLRAVRETTHEICRVATKMWASGMILGVDPLCPPELRPETDHIRTLVGKWKEDVTQLLSWLDWSAWVKCRPPACGFEEMCYLPTWPIGFFPTLGAPPQAQWDNASLWLDPNNGEWR